MRLAVLIDADNASAALIGDILADVAALGSVAVKRSYGDFTTPNLSGWRAVMLEHAIQPIQQFRNTVGKNATDSALIIDAMDLLHARNLGGFCLVSSDSDFTRLATRIREDGLPVYGFGEKTTPKSFINACTCFTCTEKLQKKPKVSSSPVSSSNSVVTLHSHKNDKLLQAALKSAINSAIQANGRADLSAIGNNLPKLLPNFDPRNYGFRKLSELLQTMPSVRLVRTKAANGGQVVHVERT